MNDLVPSNHGNTTPSVPAALSARPNALALVKALRRRWLMASFLGLICGALGATAAWYFVPQKWMARTLVHVAPEYNLVMDQRGMRTDVVTHQRDQVSLVKSRLVYNTALKKIGDLSVVREQTDPLDWLDKQLQADFSVAPYSLRIWMVGDKPQELVTVVDAIRQAYEKEFFEKDQLERTEQLAALEQMQEKKERQLSARKKEQADLEKKGISRDALTRELRLRWEEQRLEWAERDLQQNAQELRNENTQLLTLLEKQKTLASVEVSDNAPEEGMRNNPAAQTLQAEVDRLEGQYRTSKDVYRDGDKNPHVQEYKRKWEAKLRQLAALRREIVGRELKREIVNHQTKIATLQRQHPQLEKEYERIREKIEEMQSKNVKQEVVREDTSYLQSIVNSIGTQIEALRLAGDTPKRLKVLDEGYALPASGLTRGMSIVLAGLGGIGIVFLAIAWWEFRARKIETVDEVIQGLGLKLVGAIPDLSQRWFSPRRRPDERVQHLFVESIDTTRTMLLEGARAESARQGDETQTTPQVVMVTSAQAGEGKTSLATHLAASLAQIGHKTLIIDADLRNPTAHRIVGLEREPGYCELLRGETELADVVRPTPIDGLWMITGGHWNSKATRALAQPRTGAILQQLRADFDFIVIDSSPILPVVDPLLLGRHADIVLLSVLCNVSRMKNVYTACQRLSTVGIRSIRAVMSGVRGEDYSSSYQYFYHADTKS